MKIVVVGAGLAGLYTATCLLKLGHEVEVLEARSRPGGRLHGIEVHPGSWVDAGGAYLGKRHTNLLELIHELGLRVTKTNTHGDSRFNVNGELVSNAHRFPPLNSVALGNMFDALFTLVDNVNVDAPWQTFNAHVLDNTTVAQWCEETLDHQDAKTFFPLFLGEMMAADPRDISVLHMAFYLCSGGGVQYLNAFEGGAQEFRIDGGAHLLCVKLQAKLGACVKFNTKVLSVKQTDNHVEIGCDTGVFHGERVVMALPPLLANAIEFQPSLPNPRAGQQTAAGCVVKAHIIYPRPLWRDHGLSGWSVSTNGPLLSTVDDSPEDASVGVLTGFIAGERYEEFAGMTTDDQAQSILKHVKDLFPELPAPTNYWLTDWKQESFSRGCYAALFGPGDWTQQGPHLTQCFGNIFWAGTETSFEFFGLMEGAIRSAKRVVVEIEASVLETV